MDNMNDDGKTHFADDDTIAHIAKLEAALKVARDALDEALSELSDGSPGKAKGVINEALRQIEEVLKSA